MDKDGTATKLVYSSTEESVTTQIQIRYNPRTNHITFGSAHSVRSGGFSNGSVNNKCCPDYLGVTVAEKVLSKVFKNVQRMPMNNPGFDFICGRGYKIDVKSACKLKDRNTWMFCINHNRIAGYFLVLAFDNRDDLNPLHVWLIPGRAVNHLSILAISLSTIEKWSQYELIGKLDKVIACCNIMKGS